jgi:hypothetical protein
MLIELTRGFVGRMDIHRLLDYSLHATGSSRKVVLHLWSFADPLLSSDMGG